MERWLCDGCGQWHRKIVADPPPACVLPPTNIRETFIRNGQGWTRTKAIANLTHAAEGGRVRADGFGESNERDPGHIICFLFSFHWKNRQIIYRLHFRANHLYIAYSGKEC